jgi:hypothetical protein
MDIFDLSVEDLDKGNKTSKGFENEFKPNPDASKDKIYRALIRPVYWLDNVKKNYIPKKTFYFGKDDGNDTGNNFFDSAFSVDEECLAMKTFFDLKREGKKDARADELAKTIRPKSAFFYLVLVESDAVNPENEGKIMVYKAPIQVHNIIQGAINVSEEDQKMGIKPCNVFDPFNGKSLRLSINVVNNNWNYNGTVSLTEKGPLKFQGKDLTVDKKEDFLELLKEGNELMKNYVYKPMGEDRYNLLLSIISAKTGKTFGNIKPSAPKSDIEIDGLDDLDNIPGISKEKTKAVKPKEEVLNIDITETKKEEESDDFDDILDGLDF